MKVDVLMGLINNAALLLALGIIYEISYTIPVKRQYLLQVINGCLIALIGLAVMAVPYQFTSGVVFDTRSVLISVTALTFGWIPTAILVVTTGIFRIFQGGAGTYAGLAVILSCAAIGLIWRYYLLEKWMRFRWLNIYIFGVIVHIAMLVCMFLLPWPLPIQVLRDISLPVMLIYPLGTLLLSLLLLNQKERQQAIEQVKEAEELYRSLFHNNRAIMMILDPTDGRIMEVNTAASKFYGWSAETMCSMKISDINTLSEDEVKREMNKSLNEERNHFLFKHRRKHGEPVDVEVYSGPIRIKGKRLIYSIIHDISERVALEKSKLEMEAQMRQQQKLEAIGTLAGGVAHEINNPINGIINYAQLIVDSTVQESKNNEYAQEIIHESERISQIVKNLLQFSRQEKQSHSYVRIEDIINRTISLIKHNLVKDQIKLELSLEEGLPEIKCRSQQIQQVIMNILINARDALNDKYPDYSEDKIIRLSCEQYLQENQRWLRITVEDHGSGIPREVGEKIFEPFFSTKPKEKGTGLGLAISFGIVKDHHGILSYESEPGKYTRFYLDLPVDNGWEL